MNAKPGEIWLADLGLAAKTRPVLIVSRLDPDALSRTHHVRSADHTTSGQSL